MKIREIIEQTQTTPLNTIAKEHLTIGEKKAREGLKAAGAEPQRGKKGWIFNGDPENLEKSIYEFVQPSQRGKRKVTAIKSEQMLATANNSKQEQATAINDEQQTATANTSEQTASNSKQLANASKQRINKSEQTANTSEPPTETDVIGALLARGNKAQKTSYKGFYLPDNVIEIIDSLGHGDKSKLVAEILTKEFKARGLLKE